MNDKCLRLFKKEHSTSPPCGNLVDGLPHDCHNTETIAKLARLWPAENDEPMQNLVELAMFCSITFQKTHRKPCRAYIEDQYGRDKI